MFNRIIRMAAAVAGCIFLAGGCSRTTTLTPERSEIRFGAGTALLQNDANPTKSGTLKTGTTFTTGDSFLAWAWHSAINQYFTFGSIEPITLLNTGIWDYEPHQFWNWKSGEDYYDFLAIFPADADITPTVADLNHPNLKSTVDYDPTDVQYDIMAAGLRRLDKSIGPVNLTFSHALSAVSVDVKNAEGSNVNGLPLTITLVSVGFVNLIASSTISVTFDGNGLVYQRSGIRNTTNAVLGPDIPASPATTVAPGYSYPSQRIITRITTWLGENTALSQSDRENLADDIYEDEVWTMSHAAYLEWIAAENTGLDADKISALEAQIYKEDDWDLMIPQNLDSDTQFPALQIVYNTGGENDITETVPLKDIKDLATNQAITTWSPGIRYHYEIELRIGVGIVVTVTATPWEVVEAETPGLMI